MPINRTSLTDRQADDFATLNDINDVYHAVNNLKNNTVDLSDGKLTSAELELKSDADSAADRGIMFRLGTSAWVRFVWDNANALFKLINQAGTLQKISFANGTASSHGITKGQLDTAISALQLEVTGAIKFYAGTSAPSGYLLCDGSLISRSGYNALFAVIGTIYGTGDGSTTFALPDLRGRVAVGLDNMGGSSANRLTVASSGGNNSTTLGGNGGTENHTLSISELPSHAHSISMSAVTNTASYNGGTAASLTTTTSTSGSIGGNSPHSNTQPWLALNAIIKT